jgi:hypothetical protein
MALVEETSEDEELTTLGKNNRCDWRIATI